MDENYSDNFIEPEESTNTGSKWKGVLIIAFTVVAVSFMMYKLFTDEDYNKYNNSYSSDSSGTSGSTDTSGNSYTASTSKTNNNTSVASSPQTGDKAEEENKNETPAAIVTPPSKQPERDKVESKPMVVTPPVKPAPTPKPVVVPPTNPVVQKKEKTPPVINISKATPLPNKTNTVVSVPPPGKPKTKPVVKPEMKPDKSMSNGDLQDLVSEISQKGTAAGVYSKCVQLYSTATGNNKTAMEQIEAYLRSQKYTIAGRGSVPSNFAGRKITAVNGCMRLTVGSL